jgi:hypothetical protein
MYGKIFASMFTGSLMGSGSHVYAVMTYAVANADAEGFVELNPALLAALIGDPRERIEQAIEHLCAADPHSRTPDEDGRRLVQEGQFLFRIVNYAKYRGQRDAEGRREYMRAYMADYRDKRHVNSVNRCKPQLAQAKAKEKGEEEAKAKGEVEAKDFGLAPLATTTKARALGNDRGPGKAEGDLRRKAVVAASLRLAKALAEKLPARTTYEKNTQVSIIEHLAHKAEMSDEAMGWLTQAVEWVTEACNQGEDPYALFTHIVVTRTGYRTKGKTR